MSDTEKNVTLERVVVTGFRSCKRTRFDPHRELSAVIGINGAGKTNLLSAIRLLSQREARARRYAVSERRANSEQAGRANPSIVAWFRAGERRIGLRLQLTLAASGRSEDEVVAINEQWNLSGLVGKGAITNAWRTLPPYLVPEQGRGFYYMDVDTFFFSGKRDALSWNKRYLQILKREAQRAAPLVDISLLEKKEVVSTIRQVMGFMAGITYYSASQFTDPGRCPTNFELDANKQPEAPSRLSSPHLRFLFDLYTLKASNAELYNEYKSFVSKPQLGLVTNLSWKKVRLSTYTAEVKSGGKYSKVRRHKTLVIPTAQVGATRISFNQLSEGTFRTLALIFYIMTDSSKCLIIEEPEVCVHHGLLAKIINTIKAYSVSKQVIFSTHSDLVLDRLLPENVFVVEMQKSGTQVTGLKKWAGRKGAAALREYLEESGTLGEYWKSGGLAS